ncbi:MULTISPECIES: DUF6083 domain-containing protein [unclassified Streptomyces]|uniref:DUF6083 domain-containing protein n=1 Tax=unclassified Streptomyces TaxID=2593676 RepID=UPI002E81A239|nr:DUF6083 domain-containing protein [Streptomyces sp. NBC_00589]WTI33532.1 DUF6083 domain-containing protein [Streptomyces sp. NBC_00775]WTI42395.1 DUF6083 domain-containing protein [Streptomyces sp. NBC_00775]WUB23923.1 DUF6083 domain-containing protein [Streptomyces sp. NBC_00589]WUB32796.1 DUF6083 domain-containing protein [Streptomyces sp. NBC_00589]
MRSTPPASRHWDGSPVLAHRTRRSLQVTPDGVSRLLRCGQSDRCRECGNRIEWYHCGNRRPVRLHPHELPAARVPVACRWHVSSGVAHPAGDGSSWCRLPHAVVCPARDTPPSPRELAGLRRSLAVRSRRLIDAGAFTPPPASPESPAPQPSACRPARPIVQLLYVRYLAARPVDEIQCVAQTRRRHRCTSPLLAPDTPGGTWMLMPATATSSQLALPAEVMAVYDLGRVPYAEQLRWRAQRCPQHAASPTAADLAVAEWEPFDPLRHHEHIHSRLPAPARRPGSTGRARQEARP